ncbi:hypothetical protein BH23CHL2_BH23CHL2_28030 [soil metagenome]
MDTKSLVRWGAISAIGASAAWAGLSFESIIRPDPESYRDVLFLIPWTLTAVALCYLHMIQRDHYGRLGTIGFGVAIGAMAVGGFAMTAVTLGVDSLMFLAFPVSVLSWVVGMAMLGIATIRARVLPRSAGVALILSEPMAIASGLALSPWVELAESGSYSGAIGNGVAMLLVGLALRKMSGLNAESQEQIRSTPATQSAESSAPSVLS